MKIFKILLLTIIIIAVAAVAGLWGVKEYALTKADEKTAEFVKATKIYEDLAPRLLNSTLYVFNIFQETPADQAEDIITKLRPYLSSTQLPTFLRVPPAAFDTLYPQAGSEESAARMLSYILSNLDIESQLWRSVSPHAVKTGVVVKVRDGTLKYLDPFSGAIAMYQNKVMIGPHAARVLAMDQIDYRSFFIKLDDRADIEFYKDFGHTMMAPVGRMLHINVAAPVYEEPLVLGDIDGQSDDVAKAAAGIGITPHWNYLGQKYGANLTRSLYFTDAAKITFTLGEAYDPELLKSNIEPQVDGQTLVFEVPEDEVLLFEDSKVDLYPMSNPYISVDQIIIERL